MSPDVTDILSKMQSICVKSVQLVGTEQHVYDLKKIILSLLLYLQMVPFILEQLHFCVGEFLDKRPACGPKYKAIWIPTSPLDSSSKRSDRGTGLRA